MNSKVNEYGLQTFLRQILTHICFFFFKKKKNIDGTVYDLKKKIKSLIV